MSAVPPGPHRSRAVQLLGDVPWWLIALIAIGAGLAWQVVVNEQYREIADVLRQGIAVTLFVTITAFTLATALGLGLAVAAQSPWRIVREIARFYSEVVRGVPVLVLLFYVAFVGAPVLVAAFNAVTAGLQSRGLMDAIEVRDFSLTWRAIFALMLSYSAFIAEVFRAGLQAVPGGQIDAARALGMTRWQVFRHIRLPLAFRTILPPLGNDFISMIKDSALVSVLGVGDITQMAKVYAGNSFLFFETYNVVAALYLVMTIGLSLLLRALERRLRAHEHR